MKIDITNLDFIDVKLRELAIWVEITTGFEMTVTSLYRPGDSGVHGTMPIRGIDWRLREDSLGQSLAHYINKNWIYDPDRPDMLCALFHGEPKHLHVQVHPNTKRRGFRDA